VAQGVGPEFKLKYCKKKKKKRKERKKEKKKKNHMVIYIDMSKRGYKIQYPCMIKENSQKSGNKGDSFSI
jgi:hypothetical protein